MSVRITCPGCGYTTTSRTEALAAYGQRRHSCENHRERQERAQRRLDRLAESGPEAPCQHGGRHPHGSRSRYVVDKCRCRTCRDGSARYNAERRRLNLYGQPAYVDATPAREHIRALSAQGMGWKRVAAAAGVAQGVVWKILYGDPHRNLAPSKRVRAATSAKILGVTLDLADGAQVDATGTRRRLQALATLGWTIQALADRAGLDRQRFDKAIRGGRYVTSETAEAVRRLYDALWSTRPSGGRSEATRRRAARLGWAAPLAWDDETIDDPAVQPDSGTSRRGVDLDEWLWLVRNGEDPDRAAHRCGVRLNSIEVAARRIGRDDILGAIRRAAA